MMYATHLNNGHCLGPCNYSNDKATHLKLCNFSSKVVCSCFLRRYSSWHHNPLNIWIKIQFCQFALILFSILLFFIFFSIPCNTCLTFILIKNRTHWWFPYMQWCAFEMRLLMDCKFSHDMMRCKQIHNSIVHYRLDFWISLVRIGLEYMGREYA